MIPGPTFVATHSEKFTPSIQHGIRISYWGFQQRGVNLLYDRLGDLDESLLVVNLHPRIQPNDGLAQFTRKIQRHVCTCPEFQHVI